MKVILLLDNVRYHHTKSVKGLLESLKNISLKYIPPYSSELNSIEHLWKDIRKNVTHNHLFESIAEVIKASGKQIARNLYGINLLMRTVDGESYYYMYNDTQTLQHWLMRQREKWQQHTITMHLEIY